MVAFAFIIYANISVQAFYQIVMCTLLRGSKKLINKLSCSFPMTKRLCCGLSSSRCKMHQVSGRALAPKMPKKQSTQPQSTQLRVFEAAHFTRLNCERTMLLDFLPRPRQSSRLRMVCKMQTSKLLPLSLKKSNASSLLGLIVIFLLL